MHKKNNYLHGLVTIICFTFIVTYLPIFLLIESSTEIALLRIHSAETSGRTLQIKPAVSI